MSNRDSEVVKKIKSIVLGIDPSAEVVIYGSRARGDGRTDSDLDILILVNSEVNLEYERYFRHRLYDLELESGIAFSVTAHNKKEWDSRFWMTPLFQNISREGIRI
jgi:predicted nucleotidyltransferase